MTRRAILFANAPLPGSARKSYQQLLRQLKISSRDLLIGVDGGVYHCLKAGFTPDLAVGDWDSLEKSPRGMRALADIPHISLPRAKDRSDLFYALCVAMNAGANSILALRATGGRPDHHLAALNDVMNAASEVDIPIEALGPEARYIFLAGKNRSWSGRFPRGQLLSLFAWNGPVEALSTEGLRFPLKGRQFTSSSWGLSNEVVRGACRVRFKSGQLLVVIPQGAGVFHR